MSDVTPPPRRLRGRRKEDLLALQQAVNTATDRSVPCTGSKLWISDSEGDQAAAAEQCIRCPVLVTCRRYGVAYYSERGVYGALTPAERRAEHRRQATIATRRRRRGGET